MNYFFKIIFYINITLLFSSCTSKHLTVKSLQPSLMHDKKIYNIILEDFQNDRINQVNHLEEKLVNMTVDGRRVFNLQTNYQDIDAIVTGEVLESSVYYDIYYNTDTDYSRCWKYKYKDGKKTNICRKYRTRKIPCENRDYKVRTKVQVLNYDEEVIFSKIYTKTTSKNKCFNNRHYYYPYYYNRFNTNRNEYQINSQLSKLIAQDIIKDISPHYIFQNITIIEKLDENNSFYKQIDKKEFENIVELLDNGNIDISQRKLYRLNEILEYNSYEVFYNLALTYEANNQLKKAKDYYIEARELCNKPDDLKLIDTAIKRTQKHLEDKIKAKSQLSVY
ncbi:tetratricopeptide repeat protein [Arcobacter sp. LA11]|uniref:tetratricopeptide repeat protein n=1 Tax=Arcobacter sp. LA11 TaxID=1898176 RepID=UPI000935189C|nr:hypothetical protein [Arcobacter sp. LA11]